MTACTLSSTTLKLSYLNQCNNVSDLRSNMKNLNLPLVLGVEFEFEFRALNTCAEVASNYVNELIGFVRPELISVNDCHSSQCRSSHQRVSPGSCCQMACSILGGLGLDALVASHGSRDHIRSKGEDRQTR